MKRGTWAGKGTPGKWKVPGSMTETEIKDSSDGLVSTLEMAKDISVATSRIYRSKEEKKWRKTQERVEDTRRSVHQVGRCWKSRHSALTQNKEVGEHGHSPVISALRRQRRGSPGQAGQPEQSDPRSCLSKHKGDLPKKTPNINFWPPRAPRTHT